MIFSAVYLAATLCAVSVEGDLRFVPKDKQNKTLQVKTSHGIVQGEERVTVNGAAVFAYEGIPYAEPPLAELRFKAPKPYRRWKGVLNGTQEQTPCIELRRFTTTGSEDCLHLSVHTPQIPSPSRVDLPVMIWIYGGGFHEGNSSSQVYGTDYFIERGVIMVKFNYRVGMFGFLSTEDMASPGNYGLKDQLAVMEWVKENIKSFGGDPGKVTIFGQSAGSCSVVHHLLSKKSRGLFSAAIAMSGDTLTPWCNKRNPGHLAADIADDLGINRGNSTGLMEELRGLSTGKLCDIQKWAMLPYIFDIYHEGLPFAPTIEPNHEGAFITEPSYDILVRGDFAKVPFVIGRTSLELRILTIAFPLGKLVTLLLDLSPSSLAHILNVPENRKSQVSNLIAKRYFKWESLITATKEELVEYFSDVFFNVPIYNTIKLLYKHMPVYTYTNKYDSKISKPAISAYLGFPLKNAIPGCGHAEDIPLFFKMKEIPMTDPTDKLVSHRLVTLWTNFAKYRNATPQADQLLQNVIWPRVESSSSIPFLEIGKELRIKKNFRKEYMEFWDKIDPKYGRL